MVEPLLKKLASHWPGSAAGGDAARLELYQSIIDMGRAGDEEEVNSTSRAFEHQKGAILPVLVKGKSTRTDRAPGFGPVVPGCVVCLDCLCMCRQCRSKNKTSWLYEYGDKVSHHQ